MTIFLCVLCFILGFLLKFSYDKYFEFRNRELATISKMEDILTTFKALEKLKEFNSDNSSSAK